VAECEAESSAVGGKEGQRLVRFAGCSAAAARSSGEFDWGAGAAKARNAQGNANSEAARRETEGAAASLHVPDRLTSCRGSR